jgi:hypothetical protein
MTPEQEKEQIELLRSISDSLEHMAAMASMVLTTKFQIPHVPTPAEKRAVAPRPHKAGR